MNEVRLLQKGLEPFCTSPVVVKNAKNYFHVHTFGGLSAFFLGLTKGQLLGTRCNDPHCEENRIWLPPRVYCPDCLGHMQWTEAAQVGRVYSHSTVLYPGNGFKLSTPCPLISVEIDGVCTKMMSYLKQGEPTIGLPIRAVFNREQPTYTVLDLAWVPA
jgi:uncharacterized OB-fold protein